MYPESAIKFPTAAEARKMIEDKEPKIDNQKVRKYLEAAIRKAIKKGHSYAICNIEYPDSNYKSTVDFFTGLGYDVYFNHTPYADYIEVRW
jgi:hypothetical protein